MEGQNDQSQPSPDPWSAALNATDQGQTSNDNNWNNQGWNRGWNWNEHDGNDNDWNQCWWKRNDDERDRPYLSHLVFPTFDGGRQEYSTYKYDVMNLKSQCSEKIISTWHHDLFQISKVQ